MKRQIQASITDLELTDIVSLKINPFLRAWQMKEHSKKTKRERRTVEKKKSLEELTFFDSH